MSALSALVDDAKSRYTKKSNPHVIVHTIDQVRRVRLILLPPPTQPLDTCADLLYRLG